MGQPQRIDLTTHCTMSGQSTRATSHSPPVLGASSGVNQDKKGEGGEGGEGESSVQAMTSMLKLHCHLVQELG